MKISVAPEVFEDYPETQIGYVVAKVSVLKSHPFVEGLKAQLEGRLQKLGISQTNFSAHPDIEQWRLIYKEAFQVSPSRYRSSVESLVRRVVLGKGIWNISSVVDVYNCASVGTLLPMGAYDLEKVCGDIVLRYGRVLLNNSNYPEPSRRRRAMTSSSAHSSDSAKPRLL